MNKGIALSIITLFAGSAQLVASEKKEQKSVTQKSNNGTNQRAPTQVDNNATTLWMAGLGLTGLALAGVYVYSQATAWYNNMDNNNRRPSQGEDDQGV